MKRILMVLAALCALPVHAGEASGPGVEEVVTPAEPFTGWHWLSLIHI